MCSIDDAAEQARQIADKLDAPVWFDFNGVQCVAHPGGLPGTLAAAFDRVCEARRAADKMRAENEPEKT